MVSGYSLTSTELARSEIAQLVEETVSAGGINRILDWRNPLNDRYYTLLVGKDLLGDLVLVRQWGSSVTLQDQGKREVYTAEEVPKMVRTIVDLLKRRGVHGYELRTSLKCIHLESE